MKAKCCLSCVYLNDGCYGIKEEFTQSIDNSFCEDFKEEIGE